MSYTVAVFAALGGIAIGGLAVLAAVLALQLRWALASAANPSANYSNPNPAAAATKAGSGGVAYQQLAPPVGDSDQEAARGGGTGGIGEARSLSMYREAEMAQGVFTQGRR